MGANEVEVEDEYACVARGRLSLKADSGISKKKKKKKPQQQAAPSAPPTPPASSQPAPALRRTPAEIAFQKMQEKMQKERIAQKASMTHKQRVEKFNQHLDSLTEHFDIPKVSWTK